MIKALKKKIRFSSKFKRSLPALCYHSISDNEDKLFKNNIHNIHSDIFSQHLEQLKKHYKVLPVEEYLKEKARGRRNITSITFDDGYINIVTKAVPILKSLNLPFAVFINTKVLEGNLFWRDKVRIIVDRGLVNEFNLYVSEQNNDLYMKVDWDNFYHSTKERAVNSKQFEALIDQFLKQNNIGIKKPEIYLQKKNLKELPSVLTSIGNHTHSHYNMASLSKDEQSLEISKAENILGSILGNSSRVFAIPFGGVDTFNQDTIDIVRDLKYKGFLMTNLNQFGLKNPVIHYKTHNLLYANRILPKNARINLFF